MNNGFTDQQIITMVLTEWVREGIGGLQQAIAETAYHTKTEISEINNLIRNARVELVIDRINGVNRVNWSLKTPRSEPAQES